MSEIDRACKVFAQRIMRHAKSIEHRTDELVKHTTILVAQRVITHNPVYSGQSVLNWTAAISKSLPRARFVNVPRSNTRIAKRTLKKKLGDGVTRRRRLRRVSGGRQGSFGTIQRDDRVAMTSRLVALSAIKDVVNTFVNPSKPSSALPRATDVVRRASAMKPPAIYLQNSIDYAPKLWSGAWPSNPRTLSSEINATLTQVRRAKLLAR